MKESCIHTITSTEDEVLEGLKKSDLFEEFKKQVERMHGPGYTYSKTEQGYQAIKELDKKLTSPNGFLSKKVKDFLENSYSKGDLATRAYNCIMASPLVRQDNLTVIDLLNYKSSEYLKFRNFGKYTWEELMYGFYKYGINNWFDYPAGQPVTSKGISKEFIEKFRKEIEAQ